VLLSGLNAMNSDTRISEIVALLDRMNEPVSPPDLLHEIQSELEFLISRHSSEVQQGS
jgi:hypothetical protein